MLTTEPRLKRVVSYYLTRSSTHLDREGVSVLEVAVVTILLLLLLLLRLVVVLLLAGVRLLETEVQAHLKGGVLNESGILLLLLLQSLM